MVYPGKCPMCTWEECKCCCCWVEYSVISFRSSWFIVLSPLFLTYHLSVCCIHYWVGYWSLQLLLQNCLFLPSILSVCLHIFWGSVIMCVNAYGFCIFLPNLSKKHMSFFVSRNLFGFKVYFSHSCSLLVTIYMEYLFPSFHLQPVCVFGSQLSLLYTVYSWIMCF